MDDLVKEGVTKHCFCGTCKSDSRNARKDYKDS